MDFDRLQAAWDSPANTPDEKARAYLMEELMLTLKARRRGEILLFAIPVVAMSVFSAIAGLSIQSGKMDPAREWGSLAMMGVCWLLLAAMLVVGFLARRSVKGGGSAVRESLASMLKANRSARANVRIFWMMLPVFIAPMSVAVLQLGEVGKATERNMGQMFLVFGVALGASVAWNTLRYFRVLKPEGQRLERLLAEYRE